MGPTKGKSFMDIVKSTIEGRTGTKIGGGMSFKQIQAAVKVVDEKINAVDKDIGDIDKKVGENNTRIKQLPWSEKAEKERLTNENTKLAGDRGTKLTERSGLVDQAYELEKQHDGLIALRNKQVRILSAPREL